MRYVSLLNPLACELEDPRGFPMGFISSCTHLRQLLLPLLPFRLHIKPFIPFSRFTSPHRTRPPNFFFWDLVAYNAAVSIDYRLLLLLPPPSSHTHTHTRTLSQPCTQVTPTQHLISCLLTRPYSLQTSRLPGNSPSHITLYEPTTTN